MVKVIRKFIHKFLFRYFQMELKDLPMEALSRNEIDILLSGLWQNKAFRNYLIKRERDIILSMVDSLKKPSDELYTQLYGRRLELMDLHNVAKSAYTRRQELMKVERESNTHPSSQVSA